MQGQVGPNQFGYLAKSSCPLGLNAGFRFGFFGWECGIAVSLYQLVQAFSKSNDHLLDLMCRSLDSGDVLDGIHSRLDKFRLRLKD